MPKSSAKSRSKPGRKARTPPFTAATADRHVLYEMSVQNVESEIDFVDDTYRELRGRRARRLREDFCGTAKSSCEWARRRSTNTAVGLDIDRPTLDWGLKHNVSGLSSAARARVSLLEQNVLTPPPRARNMDVILAMNFSYWIFKTRAQMREYFASVRASLAPGGLFFLDHYGGSDSMKEQREKRDIDGKFTYVWDQASYNPINGDLTCHIHFAFKDGSRMKRAFSYHWRLWTLPEIQELLLEAGFRTATVYWEGEDDDGEGDGVFTPAEVGDADDAFITYVVAEG